MRAPKNTLAIAMSALGHKRTLLFYSITSSARASRTAENCGRPSAFAVLSSAALAAPVREIPAASYLPQCPGIVAAEDTPPKGG